MFKKLRRSINPSKVILPIKIPSQLSFLKNVLIEIFIRNFYFNYLSLAHTGSELKQAMTAFLFGYQIIDLIDVWATVWL